MAGVDTAWLVTCSGALSVGRLSSGLVLKAVSPGSLVLTVVRVHREVLWWHVGRTAGR